MKKVSFFYLIFQIITLIIVTVFLINNINYIKPYFTSFLLFYIITILSINFIKRIDLRRFYISIVLSIFFISIFFKNHLFPELLIFTLNRIILLLFIFIKIPYYKKFKIIFINTFLLIVILEIFLRLFYFILPVNILKRQNEIMRLYPGQKINNVIVNKHGFIGSDFLDNKNKKTWLFIGDSFGVGIVDYKHNFIKMCEDSFDIRSINLSQPGFSPYDYYNQLIKYYDKIHPDYVFIILFTGNDVSEWYIPENNWSYNNWRIINFFRNIYYFSKYKNNDYADFEEMDFIEIEKRRSKILYENKNNEKLLKRYFAFIDKIGQFLISKNAKFSFIIIPDEFEVNINLQNKINENNNIKDWNKINKETINYLKSRNYQYINTINILKYSFENNNNPYRINNTHINKLGNYLIFLQIKQFYNNKLFDKK